MDLTPDLNVCVRPHLCGGPAVDTGSSPAGKQPVGQSQEDGLRPQHRRADVQTERHTVMARWRYMEGFMIYSTFSMLLRVWTFGPKEPSFCLPGMARFHSGTSSSSSGRLDIQSGFPPSSSRRPCSIIFSSNTSLSSSLNYYGGFASSLLVLFLSRQRKSSAYETSVSVIASSTS